MENTTFAQAMQLFEQKCGNPTTFFVNCEERAKAKISFQETRIRELAHSQNLDMTTMALAQEEMAGFKRELALATKRRQDVEKMLFETLREAFNRGRPVNQQIGA